MPINPASSCNYKPPAFSRWLLTLNDIFMTVRVVVTGASGFIGSALVKSLQADLNFDVIPVCRSNGDHNSILVEDYRDAPIGDVLIHLAENPDRAKVNRLGVKEMEKSVAVLDALMREGHQFVIYCSSAALYGDKGRQQPYLETMPVVASDIYSQLKLLNEKKVVRSGGAVIRLSNVVGPGMAESNVLSDILFQLSDNDPVVVRNSGPVRDFVWVDDVVGGIIKVLKRKGAGIYNIGSGHGVSIHELALLVLEEYGQQNRGIRSVIQPDYQSFNVVNISKMREEMEWVPKTSIRASIRMLLELRRTVSI